MSDGPQYDDDVRVEGQGELLHGPQPSDDLHLQEVADHFDAEDSSKGGERSNS